MRINGMIDTEQLITRRFEVIAPEDGSEDFEATYSRSGRKYRPVHVRIEYRVNRGATVPYWYIWRIAVRGQRVLKNGKLSDAYESQHTTTYLPERAPAWALELAGELNPQSAPEIRDRRV